MLFAIKIIGVAGLAPGAPKIEPSDNFYVMAYDADAHQGRGEVQTTDDITKALHFPTQTEAWAAWKRQSRLQPLRSDGRPNRPLTAFTITLVEVPTKEVLI